ncbi:MAG: hypothetical protein JST00_02000 [Deltaproteobacteria bacterium]|nr:hypothetical protein [Deltaproteobacteria bacterium]
MKKSTVTWLGASALAIPVLAGCAESTQSGIGTDQTQTQALTSDSGGGEGRRHHGPPPEAFTACEGKAVDAACTVVLGDKSLEGKCLAPPPGAPDTRNACAPKDRPPHGGPGGRPPHPPPPEAFDACNGKVVDASCTVALGDRSLDGKCVLPPPEANEKRLVCAPPHPPGGPGGPPPVHP